MRALTLGHTALVTYALGVGCGVSATLCLLSPTYGEMGLFGAVAALCAVVALIVASGD